MSRSSPENLPTSEEPTRAFDVTGASSSDGSIEWGEGDRPVVEVARRIGEYEIRQLLGTGGMGQVFLAEHVRMQRVVALKMLPTQRSADPKAIERFYGEVRAASRVMHPNIVTAFDAGEFDGAPYLAMEYVDGRTLTAIVAERGPLSVGEAAAVIRQASMGLLHAHRAGVVHRDVKPGNLMRASDGTIKVLDLGLARIGELQLEPERRADASGSAGPTGKGGRLVGTLPFMSPEQLEDPDSADARSDIYSLGATFYYLLTGRPPFGGEFLDQVYGHRHGEIPDLMQVRDDVDLRLAHIFNRMMAKCPDERYASLDEVIEDLGDYAEPSATPVWLAEFTQQQRGAEASTFQGGSTQGRTSRVLGIDLGMFYAAAAEAGPGGEVGVLSAGGGDQHLFRIAVASEDNRFLYGDEAMGLRLKKPQHVAHCLPMYIGQRMVEREIGGRTCPPEVLLAMTIRRVVRNAWSGDRPPDAVAVTVPSSYDQLHRRSILQAAFMAGLGSVRLVDRSLAATQTLLLEASPLLAAGPAPGIEIGRDERVLFVGLSGQGTEVAVMRHDGSRLLQLATAGHWNHGTLGWLHRLVDQAAERFRQTAGFDPRERLKTAARLQIACERAMNSLLLHPATEISIESGGRKQSVTVRRDRWLESCHDLADRLRGTIELACRRASVAPESIERCVSFGPILRLPALQDRLLSGWGKRYRLEAVDRLDAARGAAAALAGELPGRGEMAMPPRSVASQSIGIVVEDGRGRRRILPVIPRGTMLPARTNRRLKADPQRRSMTLSLVESSGLDADDWHALGRYDLQLDTADDRSGAWRRTRMIGFDLDVNGLLTVRVQKPGFPGSVKLRPLPEPSIAQDELPQWTEWLDSLDR